MNPLLYLCYGPSRNFEEARYSILSVLRLQQDIKPTFRIAIYTDAPEAFSDFEVETVLISSATLESWMGGSDYIHRRKTMTVIDALERFEQAVAFVDCDTYFLKPADQLFERISPGHACLHLIEGRLEETRSAVDQSVSDLVRDHQFIDAKGRPLTISRDARMWNSGVIGIHHDDLALMFESLNLTDQMWPKLKPWAPGKKAHHLEQFATGYFLERLTLTECDDIVYHYWPEHLRDPFAKEVGQLVHPLKGMSLLEHANYAYQRRPQADLFRKFKMRVREYLRSAGVRVPGIRNSA
jgi:hypothetical protein